MRNKLKFIEFMHTKKLDKRTLKVKKKKKKHRIYFFDFNQFLILRHFSINLI